MGLLAYEAVVSNPGFDYAAKHANSVSITVDNVKKAGIDPKQVRLSWTMKENGQSAELDFIVSNE